MNRVRSVVVASFAAMLLTASPVGAQRIVTYTQDSAGPDSLVYGLPVPLPIDSLEPVDGFRTYAALEARLQSLALTSADLSAHDIGRSTAARTQWAYVASDVDDIDGEGRPESAFFINATTHAREWAAPEVATGTIERLVAGAGDQGLVRYLLDNTRVIVVPVQNVDGFLQTQRTPAQAVLGTDPDYPATWPRDGRMRRKNMRGVDEALGTLGDHLGGVDLNRNHPPFWATSVGSGGASSNPASLLFHGDAPHSEVENEALVRAAMLGPVTRLRLGIDVHSFSRVFFSSNTGRTRLNAIQRRLIDRLRSHHVPVSGGSIYSDVPDPPNRGIGAAAEFFAYAWKVPAWTLELEPVDSAAEYGGTNVTHGGFILPAAQARRVREAWAETHLVAFYMMSGPPHLVRVRYVPVDGVGASMTVRWQWDAALGKRVRSVTGATALAPGQRYRAELAFNKPMRYRDASGAVAPLPGAALVPLDVSVGVVAHNGGADTPLDTSAGVWLDDPARMRQYRDDTFAFEFVAPADVGGFDLRVDVGDLSGLRLDADPETPADWADGAWAAYDSAVGQPGDVGGADRSTGAFDVTVDAGSQPVIVVSAATVVGEGDALNVVLRRTEDPAIGTRTVYVADDSTGIGAGVEWALGEGGDKTLIVAIADDVASGGDRALALALQTYAMPQIVGVTPPLPTEPLVSIDVTVLDNDSEDQAVLRTGEHTLPFAEAIDRVLQLAGARALVIDNDAAERVLGGQHIASDTNPINTFNGALSVFANQAELRLAEAHDASASHAFLPLPEASLRIDAARIVRATDTALVGLVRGAGAIHLERSRIGPLRTAAPLIDAAGELRIRRTVLDNVNVFAALEDASVLIGGNAVMDTSAIAGPLGTNVRVLAGATLRSLASTFAHNHGVVLTSTDPLSVTLGNTLLQDNDRGLLVGTPPAGWPPNCDQAAASLGFNLEDGGACMLRGGADTVDTLALADLGPGLQGIPPVGSAIDGGATRERLANAGCGAVDLRGAPRPQSTEAGPESRCDVGAVELGINPYRGIWAPARSGHGLDLQTAGNVLLLAWYTYADDGQPTAYQAAAALTGPHWIARLQQSRRDPQTGAASVVDVGEVTIDFASDTQAQLGWRFDARGTRGTEAMSASMFDAGTPRFEVTGLWFPPEEANYGATITRRGETTAFGLYYYDAGGAIRWALGTASAADAVDVAMSSFTGFCPDCDAAKMPVVGVAAGTIRAHFHTPERARLDLDLTYPRGAGGTWQRSAVRFRPLNDLVDNRAAE